MTRKRAGAKDRTTQAPGEFLYYWVPKEVDEFLEDRLLLRSAVSAQFNRISVGSRLWIVTCRDGRLHLAGPIPVARIMTSRETKQARGWDIPKGRLCAVPPEGKAVPCRNIDVSSLAGDLRFESESSPRLRVLGGKVSPQQLQTLRQLTPESARLLERRWNGDGSAATVPEMLDRNDVGVARRVVENLLDRGRDRKAFYSLLGGAIQAAHRTSGDCWSVTLFHDAVRLNVGQIEVAHLTRDGLRVVVASKALSSAARRKLGEFVADRPRQYPSVPVGKAIYAIPEDRIAELAPALAGALEALVGEAGRRKTRSPFRRSFSAGVVRLVEEELKESLPHPEGRRPGPQAGTQVHITIAAADEREALERAARRKSDVKWTLPLKARKGDIVLFHLVGTGLFARGLVSAPPRADGSGRQAFGKKRFGSVEKVGLLSRPIPIDRLRDALPEFGWLRYPRSLTTVPVSEAPRLLELVDADVRGDWEEGRREALDAKARPGGQGFGTPEQNQAVERAAIDLVTRRYRSEGWKVVSREAEGIGYDLECVRGREELHLEVKGTSGEDWGFIATAGELRRAEMDPRFRLVVVRRAKSPAAELRTWRGNELRSVFLRDALSFRLCLKGR